MPEQQHQRRQRLRAEDDQQAGDGRAPHAQSIAAAYRMAHAHGGGFGHAHRDHEAQLGHVDGDLVRGRLGGAQATDQQCGDDEQATFHQHGDADRQAGAQQVPDR
ncbi:hypothetical protein D9M71_667930 [compost metagenome]